MVSRHCQDALNQIANAGQQYTNRSLNKVAKMLACQSRGFSSSQSANTLNTTQVTQLWGLPPERQIEELKSRPGAPQLQW